MSPGIVYDAFKDDHNRKCKYRTNKKKLLFFLIKNEIQRYFPESVGNKNNTNQKKKEIWNRRCYGNPYWEILPRQIGCVNIASAKQNNSRPGELPHFPKCREEVMYWPFPQHRPKHDYKEHQTNIK